MMLNLSCNAIKLFLIFGDPLMHNQSFMVTNQSLLILVCTKSYQVQYLKESASLRVKTHHSVVIQVPWQWQSVSLDCTLELPDNPGKLNFSMYAS